MLRLRLRLKRVSNSFSKPYKCVNLLAVAFLVYNIYFVSSSSYLVVLVSISILPTLKVMVNIVSASISAGGYLLVIN